MTSIDELHAILAQYKKTPEGYSQKLKNSFAKLLISALEECGWTQKQLHLKSGIGERIISKIIHSDYNPTFDTAARLLCALQKPAVIQANTSEAIKFQDNYSYIYSDTSFNVWANITDTNYEREGQIYETEDAEKIKHAEKGWH